MSQNDAAAEADRRRKRRERVFGDVLPEHTGDDARDCEDTEGTESQDEWLRRQVPPHHG